MNIYFKVVGGHTHIRMFINGAKCGDLVVRNSEFQQFRDSFTTVGVRWFAEYDDLEEPVPVSGNLGEQAVDPHADVATDFVVGATLGKPNKGDEHEED